MNRVIFIILFSLTGTASFCQKNIADLLKNHRTKNVPYITVEELAMPKTNAIILDAQEPEEYQVSHIRNAINVGYNHFDLEEFTSEIQHNNRVIAVYCSVGIRSETIANKLIKSGYTHVFNVYGGIFQWKNNGFPVYDAQNNETNRVHVFSKYWGQWLHHGDKVFN